MNLFENEAVSSIPDYLDRFKKLYRTNIINNNNNAIIETDNTEIDKLVNLYFIDIEAIITKFVIKSPDLSFKEEIQEFYDNLIKLNYTLNDSIKYSLCELYKGICSFFLECYMNSIDYLLNFKASIEKFELKYADKIVNIILNHIYYIENRPSLFIVVSKDQDINNKRDFESRKRILDIKSTNSILVVTEEAETFETLDALFSEAIKYDYVFFVGHGNQHEKLTLSDSNVKLTSKEIVTYFLKIRKRPKLLGIMSCAYFAYKPLADSDLFEYFILTKNSGNELTENFITAFVNSYISKQTIKNSFLFGQIALMCRSSGDEQVELYVK